MDLNRPVNLGPIDKYLGAILARRNGLILGCLMMFLVVPLVGPVIGNLLVCASTRRRRTRRVAGIGAVGALMLFSSYAYLDYNDLWYGEANLPRVVPFLLAAGCGIIITVPFSFATMVMAIRELAAPRDAKRLCTRCGYNLTGVQDARCPECGTAFDPSLLSNNGASQTQKPADDDSGTPCGD